MYKPLNDRITALPQPSHGGRMGFEWRISLGNVLTIVGGIGIAAMMLVTVTHAFDSVQANVAVLSSQMNDVRAQLQELRAWTAHRDGTTP